ncbi:MAG: class I SAM-dependent methyltransferase [Rubrivivax sp.]|nr:class I SAM-dependent methyltransferase [Rubrivivax sp.]
MTSDVPQLHWTEGDVPHRGRWRSEAGVPPPRRVRVADDTMNADTAHRLACEGTALLWRGDYHQARQLLQALARRIERRPRKAAPGPGPTPAQAFHLHRKAQAERARILGMLLIPFDADQRVPLRRAPDVRAACEEAWGPAGEPCVASLRDLMGMIGAHEWRRRGVRVQALGDALVHPHYGVFSPVRGEYVDLVAQAPLPAGLAAHSLAWDIGTGTGVLAAVLARRGVQQVVATDSDVRALACARENLARLPGGHAVQVIEADLFPDGRAPLVVCNPPWLPAQPGSPIERALYDPGSRMLKGYLAGLRDHLAPRGEGWLILSDLAEHLGLRTRDELEGWIAAAGLRVAGRLDIRPRHGKAHDPADPLHAARARELTSLWQLVAA